tara:strand:+ start:2028 stop:2195 length:168 start_codon:yes stop_codon:yes gene_type:complete
VATLRVREVADALKIDSSEIIASCALLEIPASTPLSSLSIEQCKKIIDYIEKENN